MAERLSRLGDTAPAAADLPKVEVLRAASAQDRLRPISDALHEPLLEVVLHAGPQGESEYILEAFRAYSEMLGAQPDLDRRLYAGGLCFMPLRARREIIPELAKFAYLRVARVMPTLRTLQPAIRSWSGPQAFSQDLPEGASIDPGLRAAMFDGGFPDLPALAPWVNSYDVGNVGPARIEYLHHGAQVTSALLFGPIKKEQALERPYGTIDHFRVLDEDSGRDEDLYDVLHRIQDVLLANKYEFVNLSIGPEIPIEDDEVHGWTAVLDDLLSNGDTLATVAVGNGGERDPALRFDRVQVPSDCVNALSVGAADSDTKNWARASYSSVGPGRSPGLMKPDVMAFGGSPGSPFWVLDPTNVAQTIHTAGTSFASPTVLRMAMGIRAHFGSLLSPLAIRALLVHCSHGNGNPTCEVGWGRIPNLLEELVICPEGTARVVYQGELAPRHYLRAQIPLPAQTLKGDVAIKATFCYATETDPDHPGNYTRSGLDIVFRPHDQKFDLKSNDPTRPKSDEFFQLKDFSSEQELRQDAHKWETTLHREKTKRGTSLRNPVFDIHYNARTQSGRSDARDKMRYALVITIRSVHTKDLYDRILRRYPTQIRPLMPVIQIPIQTRQ